MVFVGAIYIEELEPGPEKRGPLLLKDPAVKLILAAAIRIQGL
jgi:hypothetical protein